MRISPTLRGDLAGGVTASFLSLPQSMAYGLLVFAPLGPDYLPLGLVAGLIALCFSNFGSAWFGRIPIMSNSPFSMTSVMLASALTILLHQSGQNRPFSLVMLMFVCFLVGLLQLLMGFLKLGNLAKYIPYPVIAGLINGTAIAILISQLPPMLGVETLARAAHFQPFTLLVGLITMGAIFFGPSLTKRIPAPFLGLSAGTAAYYVFAPFIGREAMGAVIGTIPFSIPTPRFALEFARLFGNPQVFPMLEGMLPIAFGLSIVASLQTMVATVATDQVLCERSDPNRELIGQGVGNLLAALFGGITSAGSPSRAIANHRYGGRTALSGVVTGLFGLAVLVLLGPLVSYLPDVVLAGTLCVMAITSFDAWSLTLFRPFFLRHLRRREVVVDLLIVLTVALILVFVGIFPAVASGILISLGFFIYRMSKEVIRRRFTADRIRSNVNRSQVEFELLEQHGGCIQIFELDGPLFFGSADKLAASIDASLGTSVRFVILDFARVAELDSTGAHILIQLRERCNKNGITLLFSSLSPGRSLLPPSLMQKIPSDQLFQDLEDALAWAEDRVLADLLGSHRYDQEIPLQEADALKSFSDAELGLLRPYLSVCSFPSGAQIFQQNDEADALYIIRKGRVKLYRDAMGERKRLSALCPGSLLGEMAFLDGQTRSATAIAEGETVCLSLGLEELERLKSDHPELSHKLLAGLGIELAKRIRIANRIAAELKA